MVGDENDTSHNDDGIYGDASQSKVTPIKSWIRKHTDSVKIPETVVNKISPEQKPLYRIPQVINL